MGEEPERLRAQVATFIAANRENGKTGVVSYTFLSLEALDALLAEVERLAGERDALEERLETRLEDDAVYRVYDEKATECERLAGRVAALTEALQRIADNDIPALVLSDPTEITIDGEQREGVYVAKQSAARFARSMLADVGGSE